tara:strand:- start:491 stop:943 length:453 start_codon:yes stop_codon:yes gene_type:complete
LRDYLWGLLLANSFASFDEIRAQLGYESESYGAFEWYCFFESEVINEMTGLPFSPQKANEGRYDRRVILTGEVRGVNACGFPRSTAPQRKSNVISHQPHHNEDHQQCKIKAKASVLIKIPVTVATEDLHDFSCTEPETTELYSYIKRLYI